MRLFKNIYRFFVWSSGSDTDILNRAPRYEHIVHAMFGGLIWAPAILNSVAMTYAINTIGLDFFTSLLVGIFWGMLVFLIDRYFVASRPLNKGIVNIIMRILLSIFLSILVAHTLVIYILKDEINSSIEKSLPNRIDHIENTNQNIKKMKEEKGRKEKDLRDIECALNYLPLLMLHENRGTKYQINCDPPRNYSSSGIKGKGSDYNSFNSFIKDLNSEKDSLQRAIKELDYYIKNNSKEIESIERRKLNSIIGRHKVLKEIEESDYLILFQRIFITLLLIIIDLLPLTLKYTSHKGKHYDNVILSYEENHSMFENYSHNDSHVIEYQKNKCIENIMHENDELSVSMNNSLKLKIPYSIFIHILIIGIGFLMYCSYDIKNVFTNNFYELLIGYSLFAFIFEISRK